MSSSQPGATVAGEPAPDGRDGPASVESPDAAVVPGLLAGNELVASSFGEYSSGVFKRIRSGESGVLPVLVGLVIIVIIFQAKDSTFLSAGNLTNLLEQAAVFVLFGMAEIFVLLLGEIDLSLGYVALVGGIVTAELAAPPHNVSWWLAILAGLAVSTAIGAVSGLLITRLGLPSFVVTLAGLLGWQGFGLFLLNADKHSTGGTISISNNILNDIVNGSFSVAAGWVIMVVVVALFALMSLARDRRRRSSGLVAPPLPVTLIKIAAMAVGGIIVVLVCNTNRGRSSVLRGLPWVVLIVLIIVAAWTFLLGRTKFGRYLYAIGGNAEAARRAGVSLNKIRLFAFMLAGLTAGIAGVVYESQLGSVSNNFNGGTYVLYAVAAAVIGGTSLFGGRGKMVHAVLGGLVIATIYNGMGLLGLSAAAQYMVTGLVLLAAVVVDAVARRGRTAV
jgi:D-xylose transport system permease protein